MPRCSVMVAGGWPGAENWAMVTVGSVLLDMGDGCAVMAGECNSLQAGTQKKTP